MAIVWLKVIRNPREHPRANQAEIDYIEAGGGVIDMDQKKEDTDSKEKQSQWPFIKQLLQKRMLIGIYIAQYCITTLTYFF